MPNWILPMVGQILKLLTPQLKDLLGDFVLQFYQRAKQTENPWDDIGAGLLLALLSIPTPTSSENEDDKL